MTQRDGPWTRAQIGEQRRARMRARLLEGGARVVADRGAGRATVDDFIREAGVARGTFYNHFATREDLLEALWVKIGHDPFAELQRSCAGLTDPAERLGAVTRLVLHEVATNATLCWLIVAMSADEATVNDDLRSYPRPDLLAGAATGRFVFDELSSACDLVVGTVRTALRALLTAPRPPDYAGALCRLILIALGVPRADADRISRMPLERSSSLPRDQLLTESV